MKKYNLFFAAIACIMTGSLNAQTVDPVSDPQEITVLKKANPDKNNQSDVNIVPAQSTVEKSRNPNSKKETENNQEKIVITEQRSKNPKFPK